MKKIKMLTVTILAVVMLVTMTACGGASFDLDGTWNVSTINGLAIDEVAAAAGVEAAVLNTQWVFDGESVTGSTVGGEQVMVVDAKDNGVDLSVEGEIAYSMVYDAEADTLTYSLMSPEEVVYEYVITRS